MDASLPSQEPSSEPNSSEVELAAGQAGTLSLNFASSSKGTKKRSLAWVHYTASDDKTAKCDLCGEKVKTSGNTTNLLAVSTTKYAL